MKHFRVMFKMTRCHYRRLKFDMQKQKLIPYLILLQKCHWQPGSLIVIWKCCRGMRNMSDVSCTRLTRKWKNNKKNPTECQRVTKTKTNHDNQREKHTKNVTNQLPLVIVQGKIRSWICTPNNKRQCRSGRWLKRQPAFSHTPRPTSWSDKQRSGKWHQQIKTNKTHPQVTLLNKDGSFVKA